MCGITGFLDLRRSTSGRELEATVERMASTLRHRGPDDAGAWVDEHAGVALGFRRLAIIDPTPTGHQPMSSSDGRYVLAFNGEIYNYRLLAAELGQAMQLPASSDTAVLVEAIRVWGLRGALERADGMFALAVWDRRERRLVLARDRVGEKPLYYGGHGDVVLVGSELKSLRAHPAFGGEIDRDVVALYLRHNVIPGPYSIYRGIRKVPPGTFVEIDGDDGRTAEPVAYWSMRDVAMAGLDDPLQLADGEAVDLLDETLADAVRSRMVADVPLGAFLSGGVDSSTVVALMQAVSDRPVRTFTIGFDEAAYDEAAAARRIAAHLGTDHTELYVTAAEAQRVVPMLPSMYDEPFADSSQIPTYLVSELARRSVTVALSGDGGDELFGGYDRYALLRDAWGRLSMIPRPLRRLVARGTLAVSSERWDRLATRAGRMLPAAATVRTGDRLHKLAGVLDADDPLDLYAGLVSVNPNPGGLVERAVEPATAVTSALLRLRTDDLLAGAAFADSVVYLPDDILAKVDRASMATSLEARVPLLAPSVVELAWRVPSSLKLRPEGTKWVLRQVLARYVPPELTSGPKMGFGVPIGSWLRAELRPWAEDLLDPASVERTGLLDAAAVQRLWHEHRDGVRDWKYQLWGVLMLQAWIAEQRA